MALFRTAVPIYVKELRRLNSSISVPLHDALGKNLKTTTLTHSEDCVEDLTTFIGHICCPRSGPLSKASKLAGDLHSNETQSLIVQFFLRLG